MATVETAATASPIVDNALDGATGLLLTVFYSDNAKEMLVDRADQFLFTSYLNSGMFVLEPKRCTLHDGRVCPEPRNVPRAGLFEYLRMTFLPSGCRFMLEASYSPESGRKSALVDMPGAEKGFTPRPKLHWLKEAIDPTAPKEASFYALIIDGAQEEERHDMILFSTFWIIMHKRSRQILAHETTAEGVVAWYKREGVEPPKQFAKYC